MKGNWQQGDWNDYGNRQSRVRVTADLRNGDRYRTNRGSVQPGMRPPHVLQVRRRDAFDGNLKRPSEDSDVVNGLQVRDTLVGGTDHHDVSPYKRFVTFYFINFPPQLSNFYLRKGFEVCGLLEEVVVPSRRNVYEENYGFVRYSKVRDVGKLLKAVNVVCFGNF